MAPSVPIAFSAVTTTLGADSVLLIRLIGEVDRSNYDDLESAIRPLVSAHPTKVIIDCGELAFVDSAGVRVLEAASLAAPQTRFELRDTSPTLRRMLDVLGFTELFVIA